MTHLEADVLIIGAGGAGMYAAIEAARRGAERVLLLDRSLIGRGGATVMAQMTVAAAVPPCYAAVRDVGITRVWARDRDRAAALVEQLHAQGYAAASVAHRHGTVLDGHRHARAGAHDVLVHGVVHDLLEEYVDAVVGIGAGALHKL